MLFKNLSPVAQLRALANEILFYIGSGDILSFFPNIEEESGVAINEIGCYSDVNTCILTQVFLEKYKDELIQGIADINYLQNGLKREDFYDIKPKQVKVYAATEEEYESELSTYGAYEIYKEMIIVKGFKKVTYEEFSNGYAEKYKYAVNQYAKLNGYV